MKSAKSGSVTTKSVFIFYNVFGDVLQAQKNTVLFQAKNGVCLALFATFFATQATYVNGQGLFNGEHASMWHAFANGM